MRRLLLFITVLGSFLASTVSFSQERSLDLRDVYLLSLRQHPSIVIREDGILAAESDHEAARWQRFPRAGIDLGNAFSQESATGKGLDHQGATFRLQQPLWSGGRIDAEIDAARLRHTLAEWDKRQAEEDLLIRGAELYVERQRWAARLAVAQENVAEHQRLLALIQRRRDQKVSSEADFALAQARWQQALAEQQGFILNEQKVLASLAQLLGSSLEGIEFRRVGAAVLNGPSLSDTVDAASAVSPRLQRLRVELALAQAEEALRQSALYPQLALRYEKMTGNMQTTASQRWMLAVEYQPGAGLGSLAAAQAAARRVQMADRAMDLGLRELQERVAERFHEWKAYAAQIETAQLSMAATQSVMASYLRQFTAGRKTWQEVLNAQREMAQAAYAAIDAEQGEILATQRLAVLTGLVTSTSLRVLPSP